MCQTRADPSDENWSIRHSPIPHFSSETALTFFTCGDRFPPISRLSFHKLLTAGGGYGFLDILSPRTFRSECVRVRVSGLCSNILASDYGSYSRKHHRPN